MVEPVPSVPEAGWNVLRLEIGELFEDLLRAQPGCQEIQHVDDADS